jgi:predicted O-methyltransferase YrrM
METLSCLEFCPVLEEMYRTRRAVGRSGVPTNLLGGLSTINNLLAIRHFMQLAKPTRTLEIGLACGGSALVFASAYRDFGYVPQAQHVAIDAFQKDYDDVGIVNLERAGLAAYVQVLRDLSCLALPTILSSGATFGIIYVDGSHEFDDVFCDFYYSSRIVSIGGYVMLDDSSDRNVRRVIRFVESDLRRTFTRLPMKSYRRRGGLSRIRDSVIELLGRNQLTVFQRMR